MEWQDDNITLLVYYLGIRSQSQVSGKNFRGVIEVVLPPPSSAPASPPLNLRTLFSAISAIANST